MFIIWGGSLDKNRVMTFTKAINVVQSIRPQAVLLRRASNILFILVFCAHYTFKLDLAQS